MHFYTKLPALLPEMAKSVMHLLLPQLCAGCRTPLLYRERVLCMGCLMELPQTGFHTIETNEAAMRIAGRIPFQHATAFAYFTPDGLLQHLLHLLKYKGRKEVGIFLGAQAGYALKNVAWARSLDAIIPVPLHAKKEAARGYNQTALIAWGMGEVLSIPVMERALIRTKHTASQTRMSREERVQNVADAFQLSSGTELAGRNVLLIDDVLTTGATLEAASAAMRSVPDISLNILTIGMAMM
jgi:ComF family protein